MTSCPVNSLMNPKLLITIDSQNGIYYAIHMTVTELKAVQESTKSKNVGGVAGERLTTIINRIERLEEEKQAIADDIKEVYAEAKGTGFDTKTIRKLVSLRKIDPEKRREQEDMLDLYKCAVGME